jgi:hypothetical protein
VQRGAPPVVPRHCSDPELMRLADERQEAFSQTMARLDGQQQKELLADQNGWVRSYATACGAPPDAAPPTPVPDTMRVCFIRAAQARIPISGHAGRPEMRPPLLHRAPPSRRRRQLLRPRLCRRPQIRQCRLAQRRRLHRQCRIGGGAPPHVSATLGSGRAWCRGRRSILTSMHRVRPARGRRHPRRRPPAYNDGRPLSQCRRRILRVTCKSGR